MTVISLSNKHKNYVVVRGVRCYLHAVYEDAAHSTRVWMHSSDGFGLYLLRAGMTRGPVLKYLRKREIRCLNLREPLPTCWSPLIDSNEEFQGIECDYYALGTVFGNLDVLAPAHNSYTDKYYTTLYEFDRAHLLRLQASFDQVYWLCFTELFPQHNLQPGAWHPLTTGLSALSNHKKDVAIMRALRSNTLVLNELRAYVSILGTEPAKNVTAFVLNLV